VLRYLPVDAFLCPLLKKYLIWPSFSLYQCEFNLLKCLLFVGCVSTFTFTGHRSTSKPSPTPLQLMAEPTCLPASQPATCSAHMFSDEPLACSFSWQSKVVDPKTMYSSKFSLDFYMFEILIESLLCFAPTRFNTCAIFGAKSWLLLSRFHELRRWTSGKTDFPMYYSVEMISLTSAWSLWCVKKGVWQTSLCCAMMMTCIDICLFGVNLTLKYWMMDAVNSNESLVTPYNMPNK